MLQQIALTVFLSMVIIGTQQRSRIFRYNYFNLELCELVLFSDINLILSSGHLL